MGSDKDKEYGLNPGEFESLKAKHDRAVKNDPFVTFAESRTDIERSDSAFGGLVRWDRKSSVEFKLDARGSSPRATTWGRKEIINLRIPALLPLGVLGLAIYAVRILGSYGHSGVTLILLGILTTFTVLGLCMTSLRWDIFWGGVFLLVGCCAGIWFLPRILQSDRPIGSDPVTSVSTPAERWKSDEELAKEQEAYLQKHPEDAARLRKQNEQLRRALDAQDKKK